MYPRSGFRSGGTSERTLVPVFVPGEHPPKPPFWKNDFFVDFDLRATGFSADFATELCVFCPHESSGSCIGNNLFVWPGSP